MKNIIKGIVLSVAVCASVVALAGELPPPRPITDLVSINNNTGGEIVWQYQDTFGACTATPGTGIEGAGRQSEQSKVTCSWAAQGQFNFTDSFGNTVGSVNVGYGPCFLISNNSPYQIAVTPSTSHCVITVNTATRG